MKLSFLLPIALRNLTRHVRRSVLTSTSVALSAGLLFFALGFYRGTYREMMQESFIRFKTGHIIVQTPAFNERDPSTWVDSTSLFAGYTPLSAWLLAQPQVRGVSTRLSCPGFVGNGREKYPVMLTGVDQASEPRASVVADAMAEGAYLDSVDGIIMGRPLTELFDLRLGDACYVQSQTTHGTPNLEVLTLSGIYNTGFIELDRNTVFLRLAAAQRLFDTPEAANRIQVMLKETRATAAMLPRVRERTAGSLKIEPWETYAQALLQDAKGDQLFFNIMIAILLLISVSTIASTMSMSVFERTGEIGTLRATGWERRDIVRLFLAEAAMLGIFGSLAGLVLFTPLTAYMSAVGFDFSRATETIAVPMFRMITRPEWPDAAIALAVGLAATFAGGFLPARRAGTLPIVDCLKNQ